MLNNDNDAMQIVIKRLSNKNVNAVEREFLLMTKKLLKIYSFVDNQTYPRPTHPRADKRKDAYFTLISIILSLRTTLENEKKAVNSFCQKYKSINEVINADILEIADTIRCAGMPQKKANIIVQASKYIMINYDGDINTINNGTIRDVRNNLLKIPGLGEKSASCMLELAFNRPSIVIDINVFRVTSRFFFGNNNLSFNKAQDVLMIKKFIENQLVKDYKIYQILHTMLLLHGKYVCKSSPNCKECDFCEKCNYAKKKNIVYQLKMF